MPQLARVGVIGGSGLYEMEGAEVVERVTVDTPYGPPSDAVTLARVDGELLAFLPRHGPGHVHPPHQVPYRANIFALRQLGIERVVGVNAVGSLDEDLAPGHLALPDDVFDRTTCREHTFYETGLVAHVGFGQPFCATLRSDLLSSRGHIDTKLHVGGTLVVIQGPRFSTRAESLYHRSAGFKLVGMTTMPEASLAREAGMCYAALCMITDYDVWHSSEEDVTAEMVLGRVADLTREARKLLIGAVPALVARDPCDHDPAEAIVTARASVDRELWTELAPLVGPRPPGA